MGKSPIRMILLDEKTLTASLDREGYRSMGVQVTNVMTHKELVEKISAKPFDIIMINYDFAQIYPVDVIQSLKQTHPNIPIVVTSARPNQGWQEEMGRLGVALMVEQPVPRQFLIEKIKHLLEIEVRQARRVPYHDIGVQFAFFQKKGFDKDQLIKCSLVDLSVSGILVLSPVAVAHDAVLKFSVKLPSEKAPIKADCEVIRVKDLPQPHAFVTEVACRFDRFDGKSEERLAKFLAQFNQDLQQLSYY